jgi:hypothetical protein
MKHSVIDNFLDEDIFDGLVNLITDKEKTGNTIMPWFFQAGFRGTVETGGYFYHSFYNDQVPQTPLFNELLPLIQKIELKSLLRVKANLYPNTHKLHEHPMHADYYFSHSAAILSLNTCDGYTKLEDGTKIDSVANRMLFFDGSKQHSGTTTTNEQARINININYI